MFDTVYKFGKYNPIPQNLVTRRWLNTPLFLRGINQQMNYTKFYEPQQQDFALQYKKHS